MNAIAKVLMFATCVAGAIICSELHQGLGSVLLSWAAIWTLIDE